jgi:hypothetical protein
MRKYGVIAAIIATLSLPFPAFISRAASLESRAPVPEGTTPDSSVHHWMMYVVESPSNVPNPIIHISTQRFDTELPWERLFVLPNAEYNTVVSLTDVARSACSSAKPPYLNAMKITQRDGQRVKNCLLLREPACRYLFMIIRVRSIHWAQDQLDWIRQFIETIRCPYITEVK